jgi:hypothetical protein
MKFDTKIHKEHPHIVFKSFCGLDGPYKTVDWSIVDCKKCLRKKKYFDTGFNTGSQPAAKEKD